MGTRNYKNEPDGYPKVEKKNDYNEKKKLRYELNSSLEMTNKRESGALKTDQ